MRALGELLEKKQPWQNIAAICTTTFFHHSICSGRATVAQFYHRQQATHTFFLFFPNGQSELKHLLPLDQEQESLLSASDTETDWADVEQELLSASDTETDWADVEQELLSASDTETDWADVEQELLSASDTETDWADVEHELLSASDTETDWAYMSNRNCHQPLIQQMIEQTLNRNCYWPPHWRDSASLHHT